MAVSELNEDTQDQICDLLENLQQIEKLKNKDMRILLEKIVRQYGGNVVYKWDSAANNWANKGSPGTQGS